MVPAAIFVATARYGAGGGAWSRLRTTLLVGVVVAIVACAAKSSPSTPSNGAWRLSGTIYSAAGGPIAGARLIVRDGANKDVRVTFTGIWKSTSRFTTGNKVARLHVEID